jgi:hypothetical protein
MGHITEVHQFSGLFYGHITSIIARISAHNFFLSLLDEFWTDISSPGDLLLFNFLIISHILSFVFFPYFHITLHDRNLKNTHFISPLTIGPFQLNYFPLFTKRCMFMAGNRPSTRELLHWIFLFHFFHLLPPFFPAPQGRGPIFLSLILHNL